MKKNQLLVREILRTEALQTTGEIFPNEVLVILAKLQQLQKSVTIEKRTIESWDIQSLNLLHMDNANSAFKNVIEQRTKTKTRSRPERVFTLSQYPPLNSWKQTKDSNFWLPIDFLGYYFNIYFQYYRFEEPDFVGLFWTKSGKHKGKLNSFAQAAICIENFLNFLKELHKEQKHFKYYLDWIFVDFLPNNSWYDQTPNIFSICKIGNNFLWKEYQKNTNKINRGKINKKYNPMGYGV